MNVIFIPDLPPFLQFAPNLGQIRNIDWSMLAGRVFEKTEDFDLAVHSADLAYLAGVNPDSPEFSQMQEYYSRTFS